MIEVGTTVRIKEDEAQSAGVKAGDCGEVIGTDTDTDGVRVLVTRVKGKTWLFTEADVEPVDVDTAFASLFIEDAGFIATVAALAKVYDVPKYDGPTPVEMPLDSMTARDVVMAQIAEEEALDSCPCEGEDEDCLRCYSLAEDDEDEDDDEDVAPCPEEFHLHGEGDTVVIPPSYIAADEDGDAVVSFDLHGLHSDPERRIAVRIHRQGRLVGEVHLSGPQAVAFATFIASRFQQ